MFPNDIIRKFNPELYSVSDNLLKKHLEIYKEKKTLITNNEEFDKLHPRFDIVYYKYFNEDLYNFNNIELKIHYHNYYFENRIYNENTFHLKYKNFVKDENNFKNNNKKLIQHLLKKYNIEAKIIVYKIYDITIKLNKNINFIVNYNISKEMKKAYKKNDKKIIDNFDNFDYDFYKKTYKDLEDEGLRTFDEYYDHYLSFGKDEGRKCNLNSMIEFYNLSIKKENYEINDKINKKKEKMINILIRNSYRQEYFEKCINSILNQNYKNYKIIISYDNIKCEEYLTLYSKKKNIEIFYIRIENENKYKFNLYCNQLLNKVKDGWIMFLDDDDILANNNVLKIINNEIFYTNDFIIWSFLRPDKIIYPQNINDIKLGEIDTTSFLFHNDFKNISKWDDKKNGDYRFVNSLLSNNFFNIKKINKILVRTIFNDKIANFGQ